jgi:GNAT superfamily N-acetyltransferase
MKNIRIRLAMPNDCEGIARVQVDSYRRTYAGIFPPEYLEHFSYQEQEKDWQDWFQTNRNPLYVATWNQAEVIGYALGQPNCGELPSFDGELVALHVCEEYQRRGLGQVLFSAVGKALSLQGCSALFLWVLAENAVCRFYQKMGGKLVGEKPWVNNEYFGTNITEVAYGWLDIKTILKFSLD